MDNDDSWETTDKTNLITALLCVGVPFGCALCCFCRIYIKKYFHRKNLLKKKEVLQDIIVYNSLPVSGEATL